MVENFPNGIENTVGKGEIARYEQFLLFPQCFLKTCTADSKNQGLFGKGLSPYNLPINHLIAGTTKTADLALLCSCL